MDNDNEQNKGDLVTYEIDYGNITAGGAKTEGKGGVMSQKHHRKPPSVKTWIKIHEFDYENCRVPTGETWTWDHWTQEKPHDVDYSLVHENGVKCSWWIEVDLPQVIIDLHTSDLELGSAKLADLASSVVYQWIEENMKGKGGES